MAITLPDEKKTALVTAIKNYFRSERDEEIGDLAAGFIFDFILEHIGPTIYNQAIRDVQANLQRTITDLDVNLGKPETVR